MKSTNLKLFEIKNLFNQFDVKLPLENNINIFLGENGMGKTTILNCLYCTLSGNVEKLNSVVFDEIIVTFKNDSSLTLRHKDISAYMDEYMYESSYRRRRINLEGVFSKEELQEIRMLLSIEPHNSDAMLKYYYRISDAYRMPLNLARQELDRYVMHSFIDGEAGDFRNIIEFKKAIKVAFDQEILYFPTYRRIEEDISKLGLDTEKDRVKNKLIQFGMTDVEKARDKLLSTIQAAAINGFTKMTGVLLKQYLNGELSSDLSYSIDSDKLSIALDRIGDEIELSDKNKIKELVANNEIYNLENVYLLNLIKNLINSYEKQNQYDERVKKFVSVCNGYLNGKSYVYDESNVTLKIVRDSTNVPINIQNLSSGEKQVISMFSKLYIEDTKDCIILFDEPELSLSIKWQSKFLPDIMHSEKCSTLVAVTHSPFIFDNEFDCLARDMGAYLVDRN